MLCVMVNPFQGFSSHLVEHVHATERYVYGWRWNPSFPFSKSSNGIHAYFEKGMFENNVRERELEEMEDEGDGDGEKDRLVPKAWQILQVHLHRSKKQRKEDMRLQQMDNMLRRATELEVKRRRIVSASTFQSSSAKQNMHSTSCSEEAVLTNILHEHNVVGSELILPLSVDEDDRLRQVKGQEKDSELKLLFDKEEMACLKRNLPDYTRVHCEKWPLLHVLVASGQFFLLDQFLKTDVDVNVLDEDGYTAMHRAVLGRKETAVSQLVRAGANVNVYDQDGASFLHYSAQTGSLNLVRLFVKYGVDMNHSDKNGWTALHVAVATGRDDIIRHLLVSGADKHLKTKDGQTAFDLCLALGSGFGTYAVAKTLKRLPKEEDMAADARLNNAEC